MTHIVTSDEWNQVFGTGQYTEWWRSGSVAGVPEPVEQKSAEMVSVNSTPYDYQTTLSDFSPNVHEGVAMAFALPSTMDTPSSGDFGGFTGSTGGSVEHQTNPLDDMPDDITATSGDGGITSDRPNTGTYEEPGYGSYFGLAYDYLSRHRKAFYNSYYSYAESGAHAFLGHKEGTFLETAAAHGLAYATVPLQYGIERVSSAVSGLIPYKPKHPFKSSHRVTVDGTPPGEVPLSVPFKSDYRYPYHAQKQVAKENRARSQKTGRGKGRKTNRKKVRKTAKNSKI